MAVFCVLIGSSRPAAEHNGTPCLTLFGNVAVTAFGTGPVVPEIDGPARLFGGRPRHHDRTERGWHLRPFTPWACPTAMMPGSTRTSTGLRPWPGFGPPGRST